MNKKIYILGAGNMAREAYYIYKDLGLSDNIAGFIIEDKYLSAKRKLLLDRPVLSAAKLQPDKNMLVMAAIGSPKRRKLIQKLERKKIQFDTLIHPSVSVWESVKISAGCLISKGVVLTCDIKIGKHTIININSNINHDCILGDFVTIGPGSHIGGNVSIGEGSWVGIGTTIIHNITIGKGCFIAAGAVVVNNIPDNILCMGVPAKPVRKMRNQDWERLI